MTHGKSVTRADKAFSCLDDQKEQILEKLERLRREKKMKVKELAALLGRSQAYYSVALNRRRSLSVESIAKIAAAFDRRIELRLVCSNPPGSVGEV